VLLKVCSCEHGSSMTVFLDFAEPVQYVFGTLLNVHHFCLTVPSNGVYVCIRAAYIITEKNGVRLHII